MTCKIFLVTSNLGSVFEEPTIEQKWLSEFNKTIIKLDPDIVAVHCQEIGGKDFISTMPMVFEFVKKFQAIQALENFDRARIFMDTDCDNMDQFTALGSFYFINSRLSSVKMWNFQCQEFQEVIGKATFCQTEGMSEYQLGLNQFHIKERFPTEFYPGVRWTRKGYLYTKWLIHGNHFNLINIHLFHDEDNLVALEQSPSCYSQYRSRALHYTLDRISRTTSDQEKMFLFGDFNFRLDLTAVVKHMTTQFHQPQFIRGENGGLEKIVYRNPLSIDDDNVSIERRKFFLNSHANIFIEKFREIAQYDKELSNFTTLRELPVTFQPSYPFSEDSTISNKYMEKRCPAWCDRILMDEQTMKFVRQSLTQPVYDLMGKDTCTGDHKPVYLIFDLSTVPLDISNDLISSSSVPQHLPAFITTTIGSSITTPTYQQFPVLMSLLPTAATGTVGVGGGGGGGINPLPSFLSAHIPTRASGGSLQSIFSSGRSLLQSPSLVGTVPTTTSKTSSITNNLLSTTLTQTSTLLQQSNPLSVALNSCKSPQILHYI